MAAYGAILSGNRKAKRSTDDADAPTEVADAVDAASVNMPQGSSGVAAYGAILSGNRKAKRGDESDAAVVVDASVNMPQGSSGVAAYGAILSGNRKAKRGDEADGVPDELAGVDADANDDDADAAVAGGNRKLLR